ncbi:alpha/beta fold hydrolase [Arsukibacterium sp. UBA3155]|uniref:alpha/beta fold hydrolase n=1 Tax=Arsukibacterium sp. UBA3155 TaxID=1946058 RepID=UPI0025B841D8|nr:alpha/beta fold hydrolase [Arsukibacterium sp. UBA3155]
MKLVLLPGMDGTGLLFEPLVKYFQNGTAQEHAGQDHSLAIQVLPLPTDGAQDYRTLAANVVAQLPTEDFVLVAESFSGGIAACLSQQPVPHLKGIIFVASFLSGPKKLIALLASFLPIRHLTMLPFSGAVYRLLMLGKNATPAQMTLFQAALNTVPANVLKARLRVIAKAKYDGFTSNVPAVYIAATNDRLVPAIKKQQFEQAYSNITFAEINGPHFILQANPKDGSAAIVKATNLILSKRC